MTLRERIADWISGGAVTALCAKCSHNAPIRAGSNATVNRMARTAREALK